MKKQNGITLVALVITIIVLLILAGVSISLALGNNGVLTRSSQAVVENEKGTVLQDIKLGAADAITTYWTAWATNASVKKGAYFTDDRFQGSATIADSGSTGVHIVSYTYKTDDQTSATAPTAKNTATLGTGRAGTETSSAHFLDNNSFGTILVQYKVKSSGKLYYAIIDINDGDVLAISDTINP